MSEKALLRDIETVITLYEEIIGSAARRTRNMIIRDGAVNALSKLVVSADLQSGFKALRDRNLLDKSFEALIVRYSNLFADEVVSAAQ